MRTRVKICCITSIEDAELAIEHGADALGLVGAMPSGPGVIDDATIAAIAAVVPPPVATFLLTSERTADAIAAHVARTGVSTVQIVSPIAAAESARLAVLIADDAPRAGDPRRRHGARSISSASTHRMFMRSCSTPASREPRYRFSVERDGRTIGRSAPLSSRRARVRYFLPEA